MNVQALALGRQSPIPDPGLVSESEIERLQYRYDLTRWMPHAIAAALIAGALIARSWADFACGAMVGVAAIVPLVLWARRRVVGLPILPFVSLIYFIFYGLPFITGHPFTEQYDGGEKFIAALTVTVFLLFATFVWYKMGRVTRLRVTYIRVINEGKAKTIFVLAVWLACAFQFNALFWWVPISSEVFGIARAVIQSLGLIALFGLGYLAASRKLSPFLRAQFVAGLVLYMTLNIMTIYLITAMELGVLSVLGYFLGGGRVPWKSIVVVLAVLVVLSAGKTTVREKYWSGDDPGVRSAGEAVTMLSEWVDAGWDALNGDVSSKERSVSLAERASLTQMVLISETQTPRDVPYLGGSSYLLIPQLMVPRIIWPDRPATQEALRQLSEHYGLLTYDDRDTTSIGWGIIAEAYANFGFLGVFLVSLAMGLVTGFSQRWCGRAPVLSARAITGLLLITVLLLAETNMALLVTALIQSLFPVVLTAIFLMESHEVPV